MDVYVKSRLVTLFLLLVALQHKHYKHIFHSEMFNIVYSADTVRIQLQQVYAKNTFFRNTTLGNIMFYNIYSVHN